jgi:hypothetical protein
MKNTLKLIAAMNEHNIEIKKINESRNKFFGIVISLNNNDLYAFKVNKKINAK